MMSAFICMEREIQVQLNMTLRKDQATILLLMINLSLPESEGVSFTTSFQPVACPPHQDRRSDHQHHG